MRVSTIIDTCGPLKTNLKKYNERKKCSDRLLFKIKIFTIKTLLFNKEKNS